MRNRRKHFKQNIGVALFIMMATASITKGQNSCIKAPDEWELKDLIIEDNFSNGLENWFAEIQGGGKVSTNDGTLNINVNEGCSLWLKKALQGPLLIHYKATVIDEGGPNDRVSDLNCFWMAKDSRNVEDFWAVDRSGNFSDYHELFTYYVGLGGNDNTTTRFRRYIGDPNNRPMRPEHDSAEAANLIVPNQSQYITLIAADNLIQYMRDGVILFEMIDPQPYTEGYFAFRTVRNHMQISEFKVYRLEKKENPLTE